MKKVTGWSYYDSPKFDWDCEICKFYIGVTTHFDDGTVDHKDIWVSCQDSGYIVNTETGESEGNYISSIDQRTLLAHFVKDMLNF